MGVCKCSMFCCTLFDVLFSIAIILMGKRELVALLNLSSWCLVMVEWLFLAVPWGCLRFVIVVFPDHTHLNQGHLETQCNKNPDHTLLFRVQSCSLTCAIPESFVTNSDNVFFFFFFFFDKGIEDQNSTKSGPSSAHRRMPQKWRFAGGPMLYADNFLGNPDQYC